MSPTVLFCLVVQAALRATQWISKEYENEAKAWEGLKRSEVLRIKNSRATCSIEYDPQAVVLSGDERRSQKATILVTLKTPDKTVERFLLLVFRGTSVLADWITDAGIALDESSFFFEGFAVHSGFISALGQIVQGQDPARRMRRAIQDSMVQGITKLVVTGHSSGGALAQIATLKIMLGAEETEPEELKRIMANVQCVTFGAPNSLKPLNVQALDVEVSPDAIEERQQSLLKQLENQIRNYVNNNDVVPRVFGNFGFIREVASQNRIAKLLEPTSLQQVISTVLNRLMRELRPVLEDGYKNIAKTSFIGHEEREEEQSLSPEATAKRMPKVNKPDPKDCNPWQTRADLLSCIRDHDMRRYRKYMELHLGVQNLDLDDDDVDDDETTSTWTETYRLAERSKKTTPTLEATNRCETGMNQVAQFLKSHWKAEGVTLQHESCMETDLFDLHGYVVLRLQKGDDETFMRVEWEPEGWYVQQSKEGDFEPFFGRLSKEEGKEEEEQAACKNALSDLWGILSHSRKTKPEYSDQKNSRTAAKDVYQKMIGIKASQPLPGQADCGDDAHPSANEPAEAATPEQGVQTVPVAARNEKKRSL